jgi:plasmid stabilization system protein ParE
MRDVRLMPEAERTLAVQLDYLIEQGAVKTAQALKDRVETYLMDTLAAYPRTGKHIAERDIWETWIPGTQLVAW